MWEIVFATFFHNNIMDFGERWIVLMLNCDSDEMVEPIIA
jgi:hypothetical protein